MINVQNQSIMSNTSSLDVTRILNFLGFKAINLYLPIPNLNTVHGGNQYGKIRQKDNLNMLWKVCCDDLMNFC